jgi:hypothetical protein
MWRPTVPLIIAALDLWRRRSCVGLLGRAHHELQFRSLRSGDDGCTLSPGGTELAQLLPWVVRLQLALVLGEPKIRDAPHLLPLLFVGALFWGAVLRRRTMFKNELAEL